jgi:hypothetical protein
MTAKCPGRAGRCENYCRHVQHVTSRSLNVFFALCFGVMLLQRLRDCQPIHLRWKYEMVHSHIGRVFSNNLDLYPSAPQEKRLKKCKKYILESNCGASCIGKGKNLLSTILCAFLYNCCQWAPKSQQHCSIKLLGFEHKRSVAGFKFATTSTTYAKPLCQKTCLGPGGWFKSQFPLIMSRSCSRNLNHEECILNIYIYCEECE